MRSYGQYCAAARALDVIGDRWSLLIVRELLLRECRFRELADGLPGIASNLLTDRLRALEASGILERVVGDAPRYRLTERGRALRPVLREIALWAIPLMEDPGQDATRGRWVAFGASALYEDMDTEGLPPMRARLNAQGESVVLVVEPGETVDVLVAGADDGARETVTVTAELSQMFQLLLGRDADAAIEGDERALRALIDRRAADLPLAG